MHRARLWIALLTVLLLPACAGPTSLERVTASQTRLDNAPDCCSTLADAKRQPLPRDATTINFNEQSQATRFHGRKAFFAIFELPHFEREYSINITSHAEGMKGGRMASEVTILVPRVALYDAYFKETRLFSDESLRNRGSNLERTVFINPSNRNERYLVIYGSDLTASIERSVSEVNTINISIAPGIYAPIHTGHDGKMTIRSSPTGAVTLEARGLGAQTNDPSIVK